jgi:hypothetical protein
VLVFKSYLAEREEACRRRSIRVERRQSWEEASLGPMACKEWCRVLDRFGLLR